jgi:hypothetical protein
MEARYVEMKWARNVSFKSWDRLEAPL